MVLEKKKKVFSISPGTEAFVPLLFENCEVKWQWMLAELAKNKNRKFNSKEDRAKYAELKCTTSKAGQAKFGGWKTAGIKQWRKVKKMINEARVTEASKTLEEKMLELAHKANYPDGEGTKKQPKKRKVEEVHSSDSDEGSMMDE